MNLRAGLIGRSAGWEELLSQAGVPVLHPVTPDTLRGSISALVVAKHVRGDELAFVREYLRNGGAILGSSAFLEGLVEKPGEPVWLRYLYPEKESLIRGISLMDVECTGRLPREANCLRTSENVYAVFTGELGGGMAVVTPFDAGQSMEDFRAVERYFYARRERLPSERVSRVSKNELLHFVVAALEYLHHARGLPFARLSPFPRGTSNLFAIRIDTDGGTPEEIDELQNISAGTHCPFTWFLDAGSHRSWLRRFTQMEGQEVGLHCYDHRIYLDMAKDEENIRRGVNELKNAGIDPASFAAPFGFWSPDLGRAIDRAGFRYSSEFSWAYDTFPHYPISGGERHATLQVPVHPISVGSLRRSGFTPPQMDRYFESVAASKLSRAEPLFFYHHPAHHEWDTIRKLCERAQRPGIRAVTLGEYAAWWRTRSALRPSFTLAGESVSISAGDIPGGVDDACVLITRSGGEAMLIPLTGDPPGSQSRREKPYSPPQDILRIREFDLRGEIGRQFTRLQRRFP